MIAHGYKGNKIRGLFHKAIARAKTYNGPTTQEDMDHNNIILHLPFHPNDPGSFCIQAAWRTHVAKPQWKMHLTRMKNPKTKAKCNIKWMIIAYKRTMNLGNLLSHRDSATSPQSCCIYMTRDSGSLCVCVCLVCECLVCVCVCLVCVLSVCA